MNKIKNRLRGLFNKYTILLLFTYFVFGVGFSYAYFAYSYQNTTTIVGNVIAINATLNVQRVVGTNEKMVPMQNNALSNALNNVGGTSACVDANGNLSCQVYKITLNNTGSRLQHITGTIELYAKDGTGNVYNNLRWQELTSPTAVKTGSNVNRMGKSLLATDITMETGDTLEWYIAVWISEMDYDQTNTDKGEFGGTVTFEALELSDNFSNAPNLDNGNLIPVYYDDTDEINKADDGTYGVWKKADSTNENNSWYDYSSKKWANAVIIDSDSTTDYTQIDVDDPIPESDIIAFYVWIPRYKYRVWNLNRQGTEQSGTGANVYSYPAYNNGIDIEFEYFEGNTGNVECVYDTTTQELETNLSDKCYYNGSTTPITTTDLNTSYTDAWYTHPAFTFGWRELEGFWIGKFEPSNNATEPRILPDESSLRSQRVSQQFTTSKAFQTYLSSNIDAHMLTNLEWGAVAYLTHSLYGLCNDDEGTVTCTGVNQNNSQGYFTGRSGGNIAGSISTEKVFYSNDSLTTNQYNTNGYYNYKGYKLKSDGTIDSKASVSLVASTTKNVTGVYDMSGGAYEYVMGNMVNRSGAFAPGSAVSSGVTNPWNGSSALDSKFYNSYSYGTNSSGKIASNRGRLGDATAEVLGGTSTSSSWKPGSGKTGSTSVFVASNSGGFYSWFNRGGCYDFPFSGAFSFNKIYGSSHDNYSFRVSLS